jgi:hypothetical protein
MYIFISTVLVNLNRLSSNQANPNLTVFKCLLYMCPIPLRQDQRQNDNNNEFDNNKLEYNRNSSQQTSLL